MPQSISNGFGLYRIKLGPGQGGAHVLTSTLPVIGYGNYTGYQHPGRADIIAIAPPPPIVKWAGVVAFQSVCAGSNTAHNRAPHSSTPARCRRDCVAHFSLETDNIHGALEGLRELLDSDKAERPA